MIKSILVVDDEMQILTVIKRILKKQGIKITITSSSQKALTLLQTNNDFDLLITDIKMPEIDGITLTKKARKANPGLKIIGMSGDNLDEENEFNYFLPKPFGITELKTAIGKIKHLG